MPINLCLFFYMIKAKGMNRLPIPALLFGSSDSLNAN